MLQMGPNMIELFVRSLRISKLVDAASHLNVSSSFKLSSYISHETVSYYSGVYSCSSFLQVLAASNGELRQRMFFPLSKPREQKRHKGGQVACSFSQ